MYQGVQSPVEGALCHVIAAPQICMYVQWKQRRRSRGSRMPKCVTGRMWSSSAASDPIVCQWRLDHVSPYGDFDLCDPWQQRPLLQLEAHAALWPRDNMARALTAGQCAPGPMQVARRLFQSLGTCLLYLFWASDCFYVQVNVAIVQQMCK